MKNILTKIRIAFRVMEINAQSQVEWTDTPIYDQLEREWAKRGIKVSR